MSRFAKNITDLATLYGIYDPKDGQCIYVGFTTRKKQRWQDHRSYLRRGKHANQQLQRLWDKRGGLRFGVLTTGTVATVLHAEKEEIARMRSQIGDRLCNATKGGEGTPGMPRYVRDRIAANSAAKWQDPEYRKRWEAGRGVKIGKSGKSKNKRYAWIMGKRTKLSPKPRKKKVETPNPRKYTRDDLVALTFGSNAYFPAKRNGKLHWCEIDADRVHEVLPFNWNITNHNSRGHARLKTAVSGKRAKVLAKPWGILGASKSESGVVLLP